MGTNPPISIHQPSPHFEHHRRRLPVVFKLPRQSEMDDHSASPPLEPRKNRQSTLTHGQRSSSLRSLCMNESPTDKRNESPLSPREMSFSPEQRASPVAGVGTPPPSSSSFSLSSPPCLCPPPNGGDPSEDESIALARLLMAQEAVESYAAFSSDYLRYNTAQYSQEDLAALQAALEDDGDDDNNNDERGGGGEVNDLQYELMLRLGEAIGDVKQERWKMVSERQISLLPTFQFKPSSIKDLDENDSRCKCLVCQFSYDDGDCLRTLPCGHCFHAECVDQWLKDKDCCAYCRQPIVA